jgi:hypothetical protein
MTDDLKKMKKVPANVGDSDGERQGYAPAVPGIHEPFVVPEAGHEGASAVYEYRAMAEGRISVSDKPRDKFADYDGSFQISKDV